MSQLGSRHGAPLQAITIELVGLCTVIVPAPRLGAVPRQVDHQRLPNVETVDNDVSLYTLRPALRGGAGRGPVACARLPRRRRPPAGGGSLAEELAGEVVVQVLEVEAPVAVGVARGRIASPAGGAPVAEVQHERREEGTGARRCESRLALPARA